MSFGVAHAEVGAGTIPVPGAAERGRIDVRIIRGEGGGYSGELHCNGATYDLNCALGDDDIREYNEKLRGEFSAVLQTVNNATSPLTSAEVQTKLQRLMTHGRDVFEAIFDGHVEWVRTAIAETAALEFYVRSEKFEVPWELLYYLPYEEENVFEGFLGARCLTSRTIQPRNQPSPPRLTMSRPPNFGLLAYDTLPAVLKVEFPFIEALHTRGLIDAGFQRLENLSVNNPRRGEELRKISRYWKRNGGLDVAHFACHAYRESRMPSDHKIVLSSGYNVTLKELGRCLAGGESCPLVVFNACSGTHPEPFSNARFCECFIHANARGVVATECAFPDRLGAEFTKVFYDYFVVDAQPLGESLLRARKDLWARANPVGLAYSLYGHPLIRLAP